MIKDKDSVSRRRPTSFQLGTATPPIAPDKMKSLAKLSPEETKYLAHRDRYRSRHRLADCLAKLIEADPFDPDEVYMMWRLLRIEASTDLDRLTHPDAMPADRPGLAGGNGLPVEDVDRPGDSPQLHGVDHYQQILAIDLFKKINTAQAQENQARSTRKGSLFETVMDSLSRPVIGNEVVADAEDKSGGHPLY